MLSISLWSPHVTHSVHPYICESICMETTHIYSQKITSSYNINEDLRASSQDFLKYAFIVCVIDYRFFI